MKMNGEARKLALSRMQDPKATVKEKLDAMMFLMLQDHDRMVDIHEAYMSHPFALIPAQHRGKVWATFALWMAAVTWAFFDRIWELGLRLGVWG